MITKLKKLFHAGIEYVNTKTISDEYINWLTFVNAGMLSKGNIYSIRFALERLP